MNNNKTCKIFVILSLVLFNLFAMLPQAISENISKVGINSLNLSQQRNITLILKNANLSELLQEIKNQTGLNFIYDKELQLKQINNINVENKSVDYVLDVALGGTGLIYKITGNSISIFIQSQQKAENIMVYGIVTDTKGQAVCGATILVINQNAQGAITDINGKFTISNVEKGVKLSVSFLGKKPIEIVASSQFIKIILEDDIIGIDNVVVTGVFNKSRESYTGSVTTINRKKLMAFKGQNMLQTLRNIDPSLNINYSNEFGSNPNVIPEISIRGKSSLPQSLDELEAGLSSKLNIPLIIMDGFEVSINKLIDMNDEDVESINILKDASATAIYGSKGANGVIVIVTKKPNAGKLKVRTKASISVEMPDLTSYNMLNARQKLSYEQQIGAYNDISETQTHIKQQMYNELLKDVENGVNTDWLAQPLQIGIGQRYNIGLEGGNEEFRWSASADYNKITGAMKGSNRETFSGSINLSYTYKNIIFRNTTQITNNIAIESPYGVFSDYVRMNPYWKIKDTNGEYIKSYPRHSLGQIPNPMYNATLNTFDSKKYFDVMNNFSAEWRIIKNLNLRLSLGVSKHNSTADNFIPADHTTYVNDATLEAKEKGKYSYGVGGSVNYQGNLNISYSNMFAGKHQVYFGVDIGLSNQESFIHNFETLGFPNDNLSFVSAGMKYSNKLPIGSESLVRSIFFTANANYTYNNILFADLTYRREGSSSFGSNNRFAPFFNIGLGWNLHNQKLIEDVDFISKLRIKGSFGEVGSQQFSAYQAISTYKYDISYPQGQNIPAILMGYGNNKLFWQTTNQYNTGLEFGLFDNRLSGELSIYKYITDDLLAQRQIPLSSGFSSYIDNIGKTSSRGYEVALTGYVLRDYNRNFIWTVTAMLSYTRSKIEKLSDSFKTQVKDYLNSDNSDYKSEDASIPLLFEGDDIDALYAVKSLGIDPSTGIELYQDTKGNLVKDWSYKNRQYIGVQNPSYRGNISTMFTYKNLSVNLSFAYHFGGVQLNTTTLQRVELDKTTLYRFNADARVLSETWQKPGDVVPFNKVDNTTTAAKISTRQVYNDRMFSLQSASIQYRLRSNTITQKTGIEGINLSLNMSDIFYITTLKRERGTSYPFARRIEVGINLIF